MIAFRQIKKIVNRNLIFSEVCATLAKTAIHSTRPVKMKIVFASWFAKMLTAYIVRWTITSEGNAFNVSEAILLSNSNASLMIASYKIVPYVAKIQRFA
jgi:hypothetical protein